MSRHCWKGPCSPFPLESGRGPLGRHRASPACALAAAWFAWAAAWFAWAAGAAHAQTADSVDKDYSAELPRVEPLSPEKALAAFRVAPGYRVELAAAEPAVVDPIAAAFDEHGRLFVVEMRDYSEQANDKLGRVRRLEDADGDGRFETSVVFAEELSWPTAVACFDGGVFVGAPPDLVYLKDTDGDGRADTRRTVFTGFGRGNVQGMLNSLLWGLDNRFHVSTSTNGAELRRGDQPDAPPRTLRGRNFSFDPRALDVVVATGGGQHGMSFDDWGTTFLCSNSNHLQAVLVEDHYLARNPWLTPPAAAVSIAADGPQAPVFRASPVEPWRVVRTRLRVQGVVPGPIEGGGTAAGYFTGATGVTIYRGDAWPLADRGLALVGDVGSNLVHRKRIEPAGVGFVGRRIDERSEFLASTDTWFRPAQFVLGPDGGLYVLDMYREVIEHPASLPPVIKKHLDLTSGRDRGRIWRVVASDFRRPAADPLAGKSTAELTALLASPNAWRRETAARLLYERQDPAAKGLLRALAREAAEPLARAHALYALDGLTLDGRAALTPDDLLPRLTDEHPRVREHAIRLAERFPAEADGLHAALAARVHDDDPRARYQLAFGLGALPAAARARPLAALLRRDAADEYARLAAQSSLAEGAGAVLAILARDREFAATAPGAAALQALARQIGKQRRADDVAAVLDVLRSAPGPEVVRALLTGLAVKQGDPLEKQLAAATQGASSQALAALVADALRVCRAADAAVAARVEAAHLLRLGAFAETRAALAELLAPGQPAELREAALAALAESDDHGAAELLLARWLELSPALRSRAGDALFARPAWTKQLLAAVADRRLAAAEFSPQRWRALREHADPAIRAAAGKLFGDARLGPRAEVLRAYQAALTLPGDVERGRAAFRKTCAACHRLEGVGHELAPNLAAARARGAEQLLTNVLDPNREVNPQYLNYVVLMRDGRTLSGVILAENAVGLTLARSEGAQDQLARADIEGVRSTGQSLMPEGLEKELTVAQMADLLEYLRQAP